MIEVREIVFKGVLVDLSFTGWLDQFFVEGDSQEGCGICRFVVFFCEGKPTGLFKGVLSLFSCLFPFFFLKASPSF